MNDQQVGVIRLPGNRADDFMDLFNRTYATLGISVEPMPEPAERSSTSAASPSESDQDRALEAQDSRSQKKIPASDEADRDSND